MDDQRYQLDLSNYYGRLEVRRIDGDYFIELDNYSAPTCRPISEALARMICAELSPPDDHYAAGPPLFAEAVVVRVDDDGESSDAKLARLSAMWTEDNVNAGRQISEARRAAAYKDEQNDKLKRLLSIVLDDESITRMETREIEDLVENTKEASDGE